MTISRNYGNCPDKKLDFVNSKTYIKNTSILFLIDPSYASEISLESNYTYDKETNDYEWGIRIDGENYPLDERAYNTEKNRTELIKALRSDMLADSGTENDNNICSGSITYREDENLNIYDNYIYIEIKSTYKNTIGVLKKILKKEIAPNHNTINA